jgi:hypothetical protein
MALQPFVGLWPILQFRNNFSQTVGLLGRVIIPSQGLYLNTGQYKHRINEHTDIHTLSGIRTHDPSVRASEDSSCLRPRGHCNRQLLGLNKINMNNSIIYVALRVSASSGPSSEAPHNWITDIKIVYMDGLSFRSSFQGKSKMFHVKIRWILKKEDGEFFTGFILHRWGSSVGCFQHLTRLSGSKKNAKFSTIWATVNSPKGLRFMSRTQIKSAISSWMFGS